MHLSICISGIVHTDVLFGTSVRHTHAKFVLCQQEWDILSISVIVSHACFFCIVIGDGFVDAVRIQYRYAIYCIAHHHHVYCMYKVAQVKVECVHFTLNICSSRFYLCRSPGFFTLLGEFNYQFLSAFCALHLLSAHSTNINTLSSHLKTFY